MNLSTARITEQHVPKWLQQAFDRFLKTLSVLLGWQLDSVANIAALATVDDNRIPDGSGKFVRTVKDTFHLDKTSTDTVDGITVVATMSAAGRWIRDLQPSAVWVSQATWYVDADNGDDENDGATSLTPVKSFAEYQRRVGFPHNIIDNVTITVMSDLPDSDTINLDATNTLDGNYITLEGTTSVAVTSTVTGYLKDLAANQEQQLSIAGFDAAGNEGTLLRFPDLMGPGADGYGWVEKDLGNGVGGLFRMSQAVDEDPGAYPIEGVPVAPDVVEVLDPLWSMQIASVREYSRLKFVQSTLITTFNTSGRWVVQNSCKFTSHITVYNGANGFHNVWVGSKVFGTDVVNLQGGRYGGVELNGHVERWWIASVHICGILTCKGGQISFDGGIGMFDTPAGWTAINLADGATLSSYQNYIYGDTTGGYAGYNLSLRDRSSIQYYAGYEPLVLTFTNVRIDGAVFAAAADLPYMGPTGAGVFPIGPATGVSSVLPQKVSSFGTLTKTGSNMFVLPDGTEQADGGGTVPELSYLVSVNGILRNFWVALDQDPTAALAFTIYRVPQGSSSSAATALTVSVAAGAGPWIASDLTHLLQVKAGDRLVIRHSQGATGTATKMSASFEIA